MSLSAAHEALSTDLPKSAAFLVSEGSGAAVLSGRTTIPIELAPTAVGAFLDAFLLLRVGTLVAGPVEPGLADLVFLAAALEAPTRLLAHTRLADCCSALVVLPAAACGSEERPELVSDHTADPGSTAHATLESQLLIERAAHREERILRSATINAFGTAPSQQNVTVRNRSRSVSAAQCPARHGSRYRSRHERRPQYSHGSRARHRPHESARQLVEEFAHRPASRLPSEVPCGTDSKEGISYVAISTKRRRS